MLLPLQLAATSLTSEIITLISVSYTHLDVYKRQDLLIKYKIKM